MIIQITDDFDLSKIADSGQCFRVRKFDEGIYRFITKNHVLYISKVVGNDYSVSCSYDEWRDIWYDYFDLNRCYKTLRNKIPATDPFLRKAASEGAGIRILNQDHWETLISFIISQRKSIPAIKKSIEMLSSMFGVAIETPYEIVYSFPSVEKIADISLEDLMQCKVGYRANYILNAIDLVFHKSLLLTQLEMLTDTELFDSLLRIHGVGTKVASCVCLFSYHRTSIAPIDTWIQKVILQQYDGRSPFSTCGDDAGIMQQYIFYYALKHKEEFQNG